MRQGGCALPSQMGAVLRSHRPKASNGAFDGDSPRVYVYLYNNIKQLQAQAQAQGSGAYLIQASSERTDGTWPQVQSESPSEYVCA